MARLVTEGGGELGLLTAGVSITGTVTRETGTKRSGASSLKLDSGGANNPASVSVAVPFTSGQMDFGRVYFRFDQLPSQTVTIMRYSGAAYPSVRLKTTGKIGLFDPAGTQIGSDSAGTITTGQWYMIELGLTIGAGATDAAEARLDGVSVASTSGQTWSDTVPTALNAGAIVAPGVNRTWYLDDIAINDASGSAQNTWPGPGSVIVLLPASVSSAGSWTIGSGGSIPTALASIPPAGTADASTATTQARSISTTANDTLSLVTQTYDSKLPAGATITLVQTIVDHAEGAGAGTKQMDSSVTSNPSGSFHAAVPYGGDLGAAGTWPSNWKATFGTPVYAPTVTTSTGATIAVRDVTTNANAVDVDQMALIVEYTGGAAINSVTASDTALTESDSIGAKHTDQLADSEAVSDTLASSARRPRALADTGLAESDTLARTARRALADAGLAASDTLRSTDRRPLTDAGVSISDSIVERDTRPLTSAGVTLGDSIAVQVTTAPPPAPEPTTGAGGATWTGLQQRTQSIHTARIADRAVGTTDRLEVRVTRFEPDPVELALILELV